MTLNIDYVIKPFIACVVILLGCSIYFIPNDYIERYRVWVDNTHGLAVKASFGILLLVGAFAAERFIRSSNNNDPAVIIFPILSICVLLILVVDNLVFFVKDYRKK